jgi:hypothetical protein
MVRFQGRSFDTLKIPGKPIDRGYKVWILAQEGFFLDWVFHRKGSKSRGPDLSRGPWDIARPKELGSNSSSAVCAYLMARLPDQGKGFVVYLDNLFTTTKLLSYGRQRGWGATGTCTAKSGILQRFGRMKKDDKQKDEIPWGTLFTEATEDNLINMMAWKDNALVLSMSTVADGKSTVERLRKRPSETSSAAKTSRKPFGPNTRTTLPIPEYEDEYNHQIGAVDRGNQLKKPNTLEKLYRRGSHQSLVTWLLDTALTNAYKLSFHSNIPLEEKWNN